jgi:hypothetical protein
MRDTQARCPTCFSARGATAPAVLNAAPRLRWLELCLARLMLPRVSTTGDAMRECYEEELILVR